MIGSVMKRHLRVEEEAHGMTGLTIASGASETRDCSSESPKQTGVQLDFASRLMERLNVLTGKTEAGSLCGGCEECPAPVRGTDRGH